MASAALKLTDPLDGIDLPTWAKTAHARDLLRLIAEERPERTKRIYDTMSGPAADLGYAGRNAAALRILFDRAYLELIDWAEAARVKREWPGQPVKDSRYLERRAAVARYVDEHGPDALIARVLA